jgi:hypothetical protein
MEGDSQTNTQNNYEQNHEGRNNQYYKKGKGKGGNYNNVLNIDITLYRIIIAINITLIIHTTNNNNLISNF